MRRRWTAVGPSRALMLPKPRTGRRRTHGPGYYTSTVPDAVDGTAQTAHQRVLMRVWLMGFGAFLLLAAAWAVMTPYNGAYDEHDHVVRAAGVVRGQLVAPSDGRNGRYQS